MDDGSALIFAFLVGFIFLSYMGIASTAVNSTYNVSQLTAGTITTPGANASPTPTSSSLMCPAASSLPCQCAPTSLTLVSCQIYTSCPTTGSVARTEFTGSFNQPDAGCLYNSLTTGYVLYLNDATCSIACP